jgi:hypothetical protein
MQRKQLWAIGKPHCIPVIQSSPSAGAMGNLSLAPLVDTAQGGVT